jgi:hypothetical protein
MTILTESESSRWYTSVDIEVSESGQYLHYTSTSLQGLEISVPDGRSSLLQFAAFLTSGPERKHFFGCVCQIADWAIFGELSDTTGIKILRQIVLSYGQGSSFSQGATYLFDPTEQIDLTAMLALVLLCGWDAFFVPAHGRYFAYVSHDGFVNIVARDSESFSECQEWLEPLNPIERIPTWLKGRQAWP